MQHKLELKMPNAFPFVTSVGPLRPVERAEVR